MSTVHTRSNTTQPLTAEEITRLLRENDLTQTWLARRMGYRSSAPLSRALSGAEEMTETLARKATEALAPFLDGQAILYKAEDAR